MKKVLVMVLILAMTISVVPVSFAAAEAADPDLMAYWNFDVLNSDNTVDDLSGNGNSLTLQDVDYYEPVDGFSGKTFDFTYSEATSEYDDSKHLVMSSDKFASQINGSSAITFTAYMKKEVKGSGTNFTMFALNAGHDSIMTYARANEIATSVRSNFSITTTGTTAKNIIYPNPDDGTAPDSWMHVALVIDYANDDVKIYTDGVLVASEKAEEAPTTFATDYADYKTDVNDIATGYFGVGGRHVLIDEMKIYKRALTEKEIKESIAPVLHYDFEEVCDGTIKDLSSSRLDITVADDDTPEVIRGGGINGTNTIRLTKKATLPADAITGALYGGKAYSLSMWVKMENNWVSGAHQVLKETSASSTVASTFSFSTNGKKVYQEVRSKTKDRVGYVQSKDLTTDMDWHHVYIDVDFVNKTGKVYFDGVLQELNSNTVSNSSLSYYEGAVDGMEDVLDLVSYKKILMDDLKVYRRTLTEDEIIKEARKFFCTFEQGENSVTANCYLGSIEDLSVDSYLILARYNEATKTLEDCTAVKIEDLNNSPRSVTLTNIDVPANYTYKLFVWKDMGSLIPLKVATGLTLASAK